tara:strand:- start:1670 stop:2248 length:579 start_codon:yes stop_codon:yes gene_type:complete
MSRKIRIKAQEAELDITSFMNLMIVLVPVLLMMMVFSHITVLELKLPGLAELSELSGPADQAKEIEVIVRKDVINVYYPQGHIIKNIPVTDAGYNFELLVETLKTLKQFFHQQDVKKKDLSLLLEPDIDYQTIITLMDKSRSYKAVVVASVVDAELFPEISLGDAPQIAAQLTAQSASQSVIPTDDTQGGNE